MKKFRRNLASGFYLFVFFMLIELLAIVVLQFFLDDIFSLMGIDNVWIVLTWLILKLVESIAVLIIYFKVLNKQEDPEFKITWLVGILILPLFVTIMYIIFANHGLTTKEKRVVDVSRASYLPYLKIQHKINEDQKDDLGRAYGAFQYLTNTSAMGFHSHNRVKYYKCGEKFFPDLINNLKEAQEFIFMEFFIIKDGQLWDQVREILIEKAEAGVEVRLVYDDMGCGGTISHSTPKTLRKHGIKCYKFHPFRPLLHGSYNNRDHRKIVVIDHKYAFVGGCNLADEYANIIRRFGYWKDTMIRIEGSAISNLITTFLQNYDLCTNEPSNYHQYLDYQYDKLDEEGYIDPFGDGPGGIDDALIGEQNFINIINYATKRVDISTPYLVPTYKLLDTLRNAALRGVEVNLIVPGIPDKKIVYAVAKSHFRYLIDAGVNVYIYKPGFNHMKSAVADGELAFVGTINFDFRSLVHHFECGATLYKSPCIQDIQEDFKEMISVCERVPRDFKVKAPTRFLCGLIKIIEPLF